MSRVYVIDASPKDLLSVPSDGKLVVKSLIIHNTGTSDATVSFSDGDQASIIGDTKVAAGTQKEYDTNILGGGIDVYKSLRATSDITDGTVKVTVVFSYE